MGLSLMTLKMRMRVILLHLLALGSHLGQIFLREDHLGAGGAFLTGHSRIIQFNQVWQCFDHKLAVERMLTDGVVP